MNHEEADDQRHADEMHDARALETTEQYGKLGELHRLPHRKSRQHLYDDDDDDSGIEQLLHGVVARDVVMRELEAQRIAHIRDQLAWPDRQQLAAEPAG